MLTAARTTRTQEPFSLRLKQRPRSTVRQHQLNVVRRPLLYGIDITSPASEPCHGISCCVPEIMPGETMCFTSKSALGLVNGPQHGTPVRNLRRKPLS